MQAERDGQINSNESQQVKDYYAQRKAVLETTPQQLPEESIQSTIAEMENALDIKALNIIMETRFEPFTAQMSSEQIEQINAVYERREAELTT